MASQQLDELENDAVESRQDLAERRSKYPYTCSNILMKTLKCDIKTSMTFKFNIENDDSMKTKSKHEDKFNKLDLRRNTPLHYKKMGDLEEHLHEVSKALGIIGRNKTTTNFPGELSPL